MKPVQARIFALTLLSYAGYYLCRKNLSVLMPFLSKEYGLSNDYWANVIFLYSIAYAAGQIISGRLADRWGARVVVSAGMIVSALATGAMGWSTHFVALQAVNGLAQACGWSGLVKIMGYWFEAHRRGVVMAWWGTNYVIGGFVATIFATYAASGPVLASLGWRRGVWAPALLLLLLGIVFAVFVRNGPAAIQEAPVKETTRGPILLRQADPLCLPVLAAALYDPAARVRSRDGGIQFLDI